jgi:catechol 2,3-dioxygenase-like lactoylglutathione lyase family enzyme
MKFSHISLVVRDLEKALNFYSEKLGQEVLSLNRDKGIAVIDMGAVELHIADRKGAPGRPAGEFAFNFVLPDEKGVIQKVGELRARKLSPVMGPFESNDGQLSVIYAGTENERIEIWAKGA